MTNFLSNLANGNDTNESTEPESTEPKDFYRKGDVNVDAGLGTWLKSMMEGETPLFNRAAYKNMKVILRDAGYDSPGNPATTTTDDKWLTAVWTSNDNPDIRVQYRVVLYETERKDKNTGEMRKFETLGTKLSLNEPW
jgi:hypothetical protein